MKTNQAGIALIKSFESCKLKAYLCPANVWTIGWGTTKGVKPGQTITQAQADKLFADDLARFETAVSKAVKVPLTGNQFSALVSLCYNIGAGAFAKSTLVKRLNARDYAGAQAQFARWNKADGKTLAGLTRRRAAEAKLFATADTAPAALPDAGSHAPTPKADAPGLLTVLLSWFRKGK